MALEAALDWFGHHLKGEPLKGELGMEAYCIGDNKWHQLEDDLFSSNFPAFHVHPNTTTIWGEETECQTAHQTIYFGGKNASKIVLPIV